MKATTEQLEAWDPYIDHGTAADIMRVTKLSRATVDNCLSGKNVLTCNYAKIHRYMNKLKIKVKRLQKLDSE